MHWSKTIVQKDIYAAEFDSHDCHPSPNDRRSRSEHPATGQL